MKLYLGVDGGQSGTTAVIGDEGGRILGTGEAGPCNHAAAGEGRVEGGGAAGRWQLLAASDTPGDAPRPLGLRRAVADELKRRGIDYLLVFDTDNGADDVRLNADLWGMRAVGDYKGARLYQLP